MLAEFEIFKLAYIPLALKRTEDEKQKENIFVSCKQ
jgi:hypothetical protein